MANVLRTFILFVLLLPVSALAEESPIGNGSVDAMAFVKMFLGLLFTIGIIFVLAWLSRKTKLINTLHSGYQIKTLATQSLTHREKLCLIEVGGKQILVGLAPGNINKLHVFEESIPQNDIPDPDVQETAFASQFKKALGIHAKEQRN